MIDVAALFLFFALDRLDYLWTPSFEKSAKCEVATDTNLYKKFIETCFPEISVTTIRFLGGGSHRVFEVNGFLVFKFPHGSDGNLLTIEQQICHHLKSALSLPIPDYCFYSEGIPAFPRPIAGYQKLPGIALETHTPQPSQLRILAPQIARILSELHSMSINPHLQELLDPFHVEHYHSQLKDLFRDIQQHVVPLLSPEETDWTKTLFREFLNDESCWQYNPSLVHGDFDSSNILYHPCRAKIAGIVDFEESGVGDPAWDFCCLQAEFGPEFLEEILKNYTAPVDNTFQKRITFHGKRTLFHEILYDIECNDNEFLNHGLERLKCAVAGQDIIGGWLAKSTSLTRTAPGFPE